jgi:LacI family transcriptional regulator
MSRAVKIPAEKVSLRNIAQTVDVDVATVSRALAGQNGVSPARAAEIRRVAEQLGYRPRPLRRKRTDAIGLIVQSDRADAGTAGYIQRTIYSAELQAAELGFHVHLHRLRPGSADTDWPRFISENRVDGVLVLGFAPLKLFVRLVEEGIPAVALNDTVDRTGIHSVMCDPTPGIAQAMQRLIDLGHERIGMAVTSRQYPTIKRRHAAYLRALEQAGLDHDPGLVVDDLPPALRGGQQAIKMFLASGQMPTAILLPNDMAAIGAAYELASHGYVIPRDVSLVGYDNTSWARDFTPSLTSIDNRETRLVELSLNFLRDRIQLRDKQAPRQEMVPSRLMWRESCARCPSAPPAAAPEPAADDRPPASKN